MQRSFVSILVVLTLGTITLYTRHHVRDLGDVVRTYSTFYSYLHRHPETIYRHSDPLPEEESLISVLPVVPPHIHQIFLSEGRSSSLDKYRPAIQSCQSFHTDWNHTVWTDDIATAFIRDHYPLIFPHYAGYRQSIQRANILRYALLDHFGGVYLDLDVTCLESLEPLRHLPWVTPGAYPAGVNNALILTRPHHPFLVQLLSAVPSRDLSWGMPYIENMLSTGCMFFSNQWMRYARRIDDSVPYDSRTFILGDQDGDMDPHMLRGVVTTPLFHHGGASSWHRWDAAIIVSIGKHYICFLILLGGLVVLAGWTIVRMALRRSGARRASWSLPSTPRGVSPTGRGSVRIVRRPEAKLGEV